MEVGKVIANLRKQRGITQKDLASVLNVSIDTVRRWEQGKRDPRAGELDKIAEALETNIPYLMGEGIYAGKTIKGISDEPAQEDHAKYLSSFNGAVVGDNSIAAHVTGTMNATPHPTSSIVIEYSEGAGKMRVTLPADTPGDVVARIAKELRG
jgi:transcriptional regulator with XRE-family HTH domain